MQDVTNRLVGNQVSLHATKRIPSRFLRDDCQHKETFEDGIEQKKSRRMREWEREEGKKGIKEEGKRH
jgi:hypothetical protein